MPTAPNHEIKLLSNEIREIITYKPSWFLRNGMSVFVIIIGCLVAMSFFISYPDIIAVKAKLIFIKDDQSVNSSYQENTNYYAELYITKNNFSKVKAGQKVLLKLPSYRGKENETIEGRLGSISGIATDSGYLAKVILPNGTTVNQDTQILYKNGLPVQAEITTRNMKLSTRLINQFQPFVKNP